jgi:riboflavin kinase/FMN adenylyltransferase
MRRRPIERHAGAWSPTLSPLATRTTQSVVTVGTFDGVHVGHRALVRRAAEIARGVPGMRVVALVFDPHPLTVIRPEEAPARLTTFERRAALLGEAGAHEVVRMEPTGQLLSLTPAEFTDHIAQELRPVAVVEGPDFRFGRGRAGDVGTLRELGRSRGFSVETVPSVEVALGDHTCAAASSTLVRWLIGHGRVQDAALVLARPYEMEGEVVRGERRGREIGYPTANLRSPTLVPGDGVYAGHATLPDGRVYPGAISIGTKPMFGERERAVEVFVMDLPAAAKGEPIHGLPEYGWTLRITFEHWLRDQMRFGSLEELLAQMGRDCERARSLLRGAGAGSGIAQEAHA